jgi:hypothetical protein
MTGNRAKLLVPLATMAVAAAVTVGSGADWSSSTISTTEVVGGILSQENGDLALNVTGIKPGDLLTGTVTITNTGNMPAKLSLEETAHATVFNPSSDLTLTVKRAPPSGRAPSAAGRVPPRSTPRSPSVRSPRSRSSSG